MSNIKYCCKLYCFHTLQKVYCTFFLHLQLRPMFSHRLHISLVLFTQVLFSSFHQAQDLTGVFELRIFHQVLRGLGVVISVRSELVVGVFEVVPGQVLLEGVQLVPIEILRDQESWRGSLVAHPEI